MPEISGCPLGKGFLVAPFVPPPKSQSILSREFDFAVIDMFKPVASFKVV